MNLMRRVAEYLFHFHVKHQRYSKIVSRKHHEMYTYNVITVYHILLWEGYLLQSLLLSNIEILIEKWRKMSHK